MNYLLIVTAVLEGGTGIVLLVSPSVPVKLLLGAKLDAPAGRGVGRVAGAAVLSLGLACWLASSAVERRAAGGVVVAMLLYNLAVIAVLLLSKIRSALSGVALWPAVVLHAALAIWCIVSLQSAHLSSGQLSR